MTTGYDPFFLGAQHYLPLPVPQGRTAEDALGNGTVFDFTHFSIVMNQRTRFAIFSAACVDIPRAVNVERNNTSWHFDERVGVENQVGHEYYIENDYDKGHLTRRKDICWGERRIARRANFDSFCYANIALQYHHFNTGIWSHLEDWVIERLYAAKRLVILTGPINKDDDEEYCGEHGRPGCGVRVPFGFWKCVLYVHQRHQLTCLSFLSRQRMERPGEHSEYKRLVTYQVPLETISKETGLRFDASLYPRNPLYRKPLPLPVGETAKPLARIPVRQESDIRWRKP